MAAKDATQLLVKALPSWLTEEEKESVLKHFGAEEVRVMSRRGRMRNCAFATFPSHSAAQQALLRLHQLDVFGSRLVVVYARPFHRIQTRREPVDKWECNRSGPADSSDEQSEEEQPASQVKHKLPPPPVPTYLYQYPPPSVTVLQNICNALGSVPKFYIQVLHLMNLMNLPPPFGALTPAPPLPPDDVPVPSGYEPSSDEEGSEMESDGEGSERRRTVRAPKPRRKVKLRSVSFKHEKSALPLTKKRRLESEMEETEIAPVAIPKKIAIRMPAEIRSDNTVTLPVEEVHFISDSRSTASTLSVVGSTMQSREAVAELVGASGKSDEIGESTTAQPPTDDEDRLAKFISRAELRANRVSGSQMSDLSVFSKYDRGEPSLRLYIKNLAKAVTIEDLRYIYGRYVDWSSEEELNMFDVRVMQSGRMKGQAFVGLPTEQAGEHAVEETNGFMLKGKPMVVQFARTTKVKEKEKE